MSSPAPDAPALSVAERKQLLRDPVVWLREGGRTPTPEDEAELLALLEQLAPLRQTLVEVSDSSRQLSRQIGEAKKRGEDAAPLLARKRELSAEEKRLQGCVDALETVIVANCVSLRAGPAEARPAAHPAEQISATEVPAGAITVTGFQMGDAAAWDSFVAEHPAASVYHLSGWCRVISEAFGHEVHYLLARAGAQVLGVLPLVRLNSRLFGNFLVSVPFFNYGGALAHHAAARDALLARATALGRELGCSHLELRDREPLDGWPARTDKVAMWLTLPDSAAQLWQQIGSKVRAQVKKAQSHGLSFRIGGAELLDDFYTVFASNMRDLGTPVYSRRFFDIILRQGPGQPTLVVGYDDRGRAISTGFLLRFNGRMEIPWASTLRRANAMNANMALYWQILEYCCEQGCQTFDFGRSTQDAPTYRFKKQWGAQPVQLHWHYWLADGGELPKLNPDNPKYRAAIAVWQRLPVWLTKIIGPPLVKNLP